MKKPEEPRVISVAAAVAEPQPPPNQGVGAAEAVLVRRLAGRDHRQARRADTSYPRGRGAPSRATDAVGRRHLARALRIGGGWI